MKPKSINTTIEGFHIVILTPNGIVDLQALEKIRKYLKKQKKHLSN